ncbi:MAG TPA: nucleotidyltransferase family protein, partial [Chloroflexota bacterium]|nr:nucleotidyltransferase family protein [Chloroflexota bacterium]
MSGAVDREPDWDEMEWRIARAVAVIHGISPLLSQRLSWHGNTGWRAFLEAQRVHTAVRYRRMAALLDAISLQAAASGIGLVPLKGAALHALNIYQAGDRPMADIDLLVQPQDLPAMNRLLTELGYRSIVITPNEHILVPVAPSSHSHLAEHSDNPITIELHATISQSMPVRRVDITPDLWTACPRPGRNEYPSRSALMSHLLMHVAVNMQVHEVRMLQLHDIALLAPR